MRVKEERKKLMGQDVFWNDDDQSMFFLGFSVLLSLGFKRGKGYGDMIGCTQRFHDLPFGHHSITLYTECISEMPCLPFISLLIQV